MNNAALSIGKRIQGLRERSGLTIDDAAKAAGVSRSAWVKWEAGLIEPSTRSLQKVVAALKISMPGFWRGVR